MLSAIVSAKIVISWSTTESEPVKTLRSISSIGFPSKRISPLQGLYRPEISLASVDLPQPELPTKATRCPGSSVIEKSSISGAASGE